ncbi:uncharacterized protein ACIBXB_020718 isoform 1-T1 [Morphnus guianensis]
MLAIPARDGGVEADGAALPLQPEPLGPLHARAALHPQLGGHPGSGHLRDVVAQHQGQGQGDLCGEETLQQQEEGPDRILCPLGRRGGLYREPEGKVSGALPSRGAAPSGSPWLGNPTGGSLCPVQLPRCPREAVGGREEDPAESQGPGSAPIPKEAEEGKGLEGRGKGGMAWGGQVSRPMPSADTRRTPSHRAHRWPQHPSLSSAPGLGLPHVPETPASPPASQSWQGWLRAAGRSPRRRQREGAGWVLSRSSPHSPTGMSPHRSGKPHGGEWWESGYGREAASARELLLETGDVGRRGSSSAASSSELLRSQPSIANMEELARSLMESLNITQICCNLLGKLNIAQDSSTPVLCGATWEEYPVCLQCRRCLTGSCPHCSQPAAEPDLPTLAVTLCAVDMLVHEEDLQLELALGFELAISGEPVYVWEITQRLPKIAPERCCEECNAPLPRSPGDGKGSRASFPVPRSPGTPAGQMRLGRQDARAPPARQTGAKGGDTSRADLQPAGRGESVPAVVPTWPLPPWAQPPPPTALDRLRRVGLEPLPLVGYKGLRQGVGLQRIWQSWCKVKSSVRGSLAPKGTTEGDPELPFHLRFQVNALFHAMAMEA